MQPTRMQYFVAEDWPARIWLAAISLITTVCIVWRCWPILSDVTLVVNWFYAGSVVVLAWLLGYFTAVFVGVWVLNPYYFHRGIINGAPFQIGDRVRILLGPCRDQIREIYEIWDPRNQVRLDLGAEAKDRLTDIYCYTAICRGPDKSG